MSAVGIVVIGGGGHAKVVIGALQAAERLVIAVYDDDPATWGTALLGVRVVGPISAVKKESYEGVIAIGDNVTRKVISEKVKLQWTTVTHPTAYVHPSVRVGVGSVVFAGAVLQPETKIGDHVIVNTGATVDHDCTIGDFVHIAPGANLAGAVQLGEGAFLGIGSTVNPGVSIGAWTVVGAGGVVTRSLPDHVVAFGVPAKIKRQSTERTK